MKNKREAIVCVDCKAGHSMLIPLSGLLHTEYWPFLAIYIDVATKTLKTEMNRNDNKVKGIRKAACDHSSRLR